MLLGSEDVRNQYRKLFREGLFDLVGYLPDGGERDVTVGDPNHPVATSHCFVEWIASRIDVCAAFPISDSKHPIPT